MTKPLDCFNNKTRASSENVLVNKIISTVKYCFIMII